MTPPATDPADPLVGAKLGEYELLERIGSGGMGIVYRGVQPVIGKQVAVKVLGPPRANDDGSGRRLLDEARAVNAIGYRGIVDVFGFGELPDGRQYLVMELLDGDPLDQYLAARGKLPLLDVLDVLDEICEALQAVHARAIVHRDLKPSNVFMVKKPDGGRFVKLLDFGLAKQGSAVDAATSQTGGVNVVGTPYFMAPEQARGEKVSPRTDLYALGVVAFFLLTRRPLFTGNTAVEIIAHHLTTEPPPPSRFEPGVPSDLDALVLKLLSKSPDARLQSAQEVRAALKQVKARVTSPPVPVVVVPPKRSPFVPVAIGSVVLGVLVAVGVTLLPRGETKPSVVPEPVVAKAEPKPPEPKPSEPEPPPVAVVEPPSSPEPVKPTKVPAAAAPTAKALLARIDKLEAKLIKKAGREEDADASALTMLRRRRLLLSGDPDAATRTEAARYLNTWEQSYLSR